MASGVSDVLNDDRSSDESREESVPDLHYLIILPSKARLQQDS